MKGLESTNKAPMLKLAACECGRKENIPQNDCPHSTIRNQPSYSNVPRTDNITPMLLGHISSQSATISQLISHVSQQTQQTLQGQATFWNIAPLSYSSRHAREDAHTSTSSSTAGVPQHPPSCVSSACLYTNSTKPAMSTNTAYAHTVSTTSAYLHTAATTSAYLHTTATVSAYLLTAAAIPADQHAVSTTSTHLHTTATTSVYLHTAAATSADLPTVPTTSAYLHNAATTRTNVRTSDKHELCTCKL